MPRLLVAVLLFLLPVSLLASPASQADLGIEFSFPERVTAGDLAIAFGSLRNHGPDDAERVVLTASEGRFLAGSGCVAGDDGRCTIDRLPSGKEISLRLQLDDQAAERIIPIRITVTSAAGDPNPANDSASGQVAIVFATSLRHHLTFGLADPGQTVEIESTINNPSGVAAQDIGFTLPLPPGWTFERSLSPELQCLAGEGSARCTIARIEARSEVRTRFLLRAPDSADGQRYIVSRVDLTAKNGFVNDAENRLAFFSLAVYRHLPVTTTADDGDGSLRSAIASANALCEPQAAPCKIVFDIAGGGSHQTIQPLTPLPSLTRSVAIDGGTQTARHGDTNPAGPEIEINGSLLSGGDGFHLTGENSGVNLRDVVINGFPGDGVAIRAAGYAVIERCYIGTDATGQHAVPNGGRGVVVDIVNANVVLRDNVISGNRRSGVFVAAGFGVSLTGNRIGASAGERPIPLGNGASGVYFGAGASAVSVAKNVIAYNAESGIATAKTSGFIAILGNAITGNGLIGIDHGLDLVTPNPGPDKFADVPPFPILTAATYDSATNTTRIEGRVELRFGSGVAEVELFANTSPGREGELPLGRLALTGNFTFRFDYAGDLRGRFITGTFTMANSYYPELPYLRTGEFSDGLKVEGEAAGPIDPAAIVPRGADLRIRTTSLYSVNAGMPARIAAMVENLGPEPPANIVVEITTNQGRLRPVNVRCVAVDAASRTLRCTPAAASWFDFELDVPLDATSLAIETRVTSDTLDPDLSNNRAAMQLTVNAQPFFELRIDSPGPVDPGALAHYTAYVVQHTAVDARNVEVKITIPGGWSFVSGPAKDWTCTVEGDKLVCRKPVLEGLTTSSFSYALRAPEHESGDAQFTAFAQVFSTPPPAFSMFTYAGHEVFRLIRVTSASDDGPGSLRDAITKANSDCLTYRPKCKVVFAIDASNAANGVISIRPSRPLPPIEATDVIIDARTQTDHAGDTNPLGPEIELNGSQAGRGNGLELHSGGSSGIRGLAINGFPENGIHVRVPGGVADFSSGRTIAGNHIGPNGGRGVMVESPGEQWTKLNVIGNVISGNARAGMFIGAGNSIRTAGNRIVSNGASGLYLGAVDGVAVEGNEIADNAHAGIGVDRNATWTTILGNALFDNGGLGVDHGLDLVTFNGDANRPERLPRYPEITTAVWDDAAKVTRITGRIEGARLARGMTVELFANAAADGSGFGEAERSIGVVGLPRSESEQTFTFETAEDLRGLFVTSTLSHTGGSARQNWTSEISQAVPVQ